jgi:hypothetical protein
MQIVTRFNHQDGVAPYNGSRVAVSNSRAVKVEEHAKHPSCRITAAEFEAVARLLRLTAPIRIDVRRFKDEDNSRFALFDVKCPLHQCRYLPAVSSPAPLRSRLYHSAQLSCSPFPLLPSCFKHRCFCSHPSGNV